MREPNPTMNWHPGIAIYLGGMSSEGKEKILLTVASHALDTFARVGDGKNYAKLFSIKRVIKALAWCCCSARAKYTPFTLHERIRPAMTEIMYIGWVLRKVSSLNPVKSDFTFRLNRPRNGSGQESKFDARNHEGKSERCLFLSVRWPVTAHRTALGSYRDRLTKMEIT